jgi:hypothetical protein
MLILLQVLILLHSLIREYVDPAARVDPQNMFILMHVCVDQQNIPAARVDPQNTCIDPAARIDLMHKLLVPANVSFVVHTAFLCFFSLVAFCT